MVHSRRAILQLTIALTLAVSVERDVAAKDPAPTDVVLAESGRLPILITAPHSGIVDIPSIPTRREIPSQRVMLLRDGETETLAIATARELERLTGKKPFLVVARFSRRDVDANRPAQQAYQDARAKPFYDAYHQSVDQFVRQIMQQWNQGLLVDVHAQWRMNHTIMRGTRDGKTCSQLINRFGWSSITGEGSVLGRLQRQGYQIFPPHPAQSEGEWTHLGSYTVANYSRLGIDAIQLEIGIGLCGDQRSATSLAKFLALGIVDHLERFSAIERSGETSISNP